MSVEDIGSLISKYIDKFGEDDLGSLLERSLNEKDAADDVLTIISNSGVHPLQLEHTRGTVFVASVGNLDFSSKQSAEAEIKEVLLRVAAKLQSRSWRRIYIVPFGPAVLSMLIKSLVYKVLYIETVDILHAGAGVHYDIELDVRDIAIEAGRSSL